MVPMGCLKCAGRLVTAYRPCAWLMDNDPLLTEQSRVGKYHNMNYKTYITFLHHIQLHIQVVETMPGLCRMYVQKCTHFLDNSQISQF